MKTIGLIGGMSWESSAVYYQLINRMTAERLGGFHSAKSVILSVDFAEIEELQHKEDWRRLTEIMISTAKKVEISGADFLLLGTNTMHYCAKEIQESINIPFLHIAHPTGTELKKKELRKVALLGTGFTMQKGFYKDYILEHFGIELIVPDMDDQERIHRIIYNELVKGIIRTDSRIIFQEIITKLKNKGAEGVILGCTEIPGIISDKDSPIPVFNTTYLHARAAVDFALNNYKL